MIGRNPPEPPRKGARSRAEIKPAVLKELNSGQIPTASLSEFLAVDFARLMREALPKLDPSLSRAMQAQAGLGIVQRMELGGGLLLDESNPYPMEELAVHPSDIIRGWCAYALAAQANDQGVDAALESLRPLAADPHFGVREWAWMAVRPQVIDQTERAIGHLVSWTADPDSSIRRFATEVTRPRGVWCPMIRSLVADPQPGLVLLEPLRSDPAEYVRLSVANWLNDASKSQPDWVRKLTARWLRENPTAETKAIVKRGLRTLEKAAATPAKPPKKPTRKPPTG
jgi:3-methyladenine DNA glycosylase AlkC